MKGMIDMNMYDEKYFGTYLYVANKALEELDKDKTKERFRIIKQKGLILNWLNYQNYTMSQKILIVLLKMKLIKIQTGVKYVKIIQLQMNIMTFVIEQKEESKQLKKEIEYFKENDMKLTSKVKAKMIKQINEYEHIRNNKGNAFRQ